MCGALRIQSEKRINVKAPNLFSKARSNVPHRHHLLTTGIARVLECNLPFYPDFLWIKPSNTREQIIGPSLERPEHAL